MTSNSKTTQKLLLAAILISGTLTALKCPDNCSICVAEGQTTNCLVCYKSYPFVSTQNGRKLCRPRTDTGKCLGLLSFTQCEYCKPGHALVQPPNSQRPQSLSQVPASTNCIRSTIPDCALGYYSVSANGVVDQECIVCEGGYPVLDTRKKLSSCKKWANPLKNCAWGVSARTCFKCNRGFVLTDAGDCVLDDRFKGCASLNPLDNACTFCDIYDGYVFGELG